MNAPRRKNYTTGEEVAHSVSHGIGAGLSVLGLVLLILRSAESGDPWRVVSVTIFGASMFILYISSTIYHALYPPRARHVFKILDHSSIYVLIAGSYTPYLLISLRGGWGWAMFGVIWGLAIAGIIFKAFFVGRFKRASTLLYLAMGWLCAVAIKPMIDNVPHGCGCWPAARPIPWARSSICGSS